MTELGRWGLLGFSTILLAAALASCGPASSDVKCPPVPSAPGGSSPSSAAQGPAGRVSGAVSSAPVATSRAAGKPFDPCEGSPEVPHPFFGILSDTRCEQDMFLQMANMADQLGVECLYCHRAQDNDPTKENYPPMTPRKEIANWMHDHLMESIKPVDGSKMKCKSCHVDEKGKPIAKIFGSPRDVNKAQEWMSLVMVNKFVARSGEKLKCKSCHVGNFSTPQFQAKVILRTDQLPPH